MHKACKIIKKVSKTKYLNSKARKHYRKNNDFYCKLFMV